jgi:hypothetical protein
MALCPGHDDHTPSLSVWIDKDGQCGFDCKSGCDWEDVHARLQELGLWPKKKSATRVGVPPSPKARVSVYSGISSLTLEELSLGKHLPAEYLESLGINTQKIHRQKKDVYGVYIPCYDQSGAQVIAVQTRHALDGPKDGPDNRFTWRKNDKAAPFGLEWLVKAKELGYGVIVEGASDYWTLRYYGLPALGIPGKEGWKSQYAKYFEGLDVYVWQEPDADKLPAKIALDIPTLRVIRAPDEHKDVSSAHCAGVDVPALMLELRAAAVPASELDKAGKREAQKALREKCKAVLESSDPLPLIEEAVRNLGFGGDVKQVMTVMLAMTSRLLDVGTEDDVILSHLILLGPSSSGKTHRVNMARRLLPPEAVHIIPAGSPAALIYDDAHLAHRAVFFEEADSIPKNVESPIASAYRGCLQNNVLAYDTVVSDPETGQKVTIHIRKPGPTVSITTAVKPLPDDQYMTRLLALWVPDDKEQMQQALNATADKELASKRPEAPPELIAFQSLLQLMAPINVVVPFAKVLAVEIGNSFEGPRIQRDYTRLLSQIKSVAILRFVHRETDANGRLIATIDDYEYVYKNMGDVYSAAMTGASERVRAVVAAVSELRDDGLQSVNIAAVSKHCNLKPEMTRRAVKLALQGHWLSNVAEGRRYDLQIGDVLPSKAGLPDPEVIKHTHPDLCIGVYSACIPEAQQITQIPGTNTRIHEYTHNREDGHPYEGVDIASTNGNAETRDSGDRFSAVNAWYCSGCGDIQRERPADGLCPHPGCTAELPLLEYHAEIPERVPMTSIADEMPWGPVSVRDEIPF